MVLADPFRGTTGVFTRRQTTFLPGGAAGNHTLTGIRVAMDRLIRVQRLTFTLTEGTPNTINAFATSDITSEFTVSADDTINNTGGTDTSNELLLIEWEDHDQGETVDVGWQE